MRKHLFLWFFLAVQVIFIIWLITGGVSAQHTKCDPALDPATCANAKDVGTTIGVTLIIFFWLAVDVILGVGYGIYRLARRQR